MGYISAVGSWEWPNPRACPNSWAATRNRLAPAVTCQWCYKWYTIKCVFISAVYLQRFESSLHLHQNECHLLDLRQESTHGPRLRPGHRMEQNQNGLFGLKRSGINVRSNLFLKALWTTHYLYFWTWSWCQLCHCQSAWNSGEWHYCRALEHWLRWNPQYSDPSRVCSQLSCSRVKIVYT